MSCAAYGTIFRITSGLRSQFYFNRRVSERRNKLFEEGYWKDFLELVSVFEEVSKTLSSIFFIKTYKAAKNLKTPGAYTESTDTILTLRPSKDY
jgi:hypothetical protein